LLDSLLQEIANYFQCEGTQTFDGHVVDLLLQFVDSWVHVVAGGVRGGEDGGHPRPGGGRHRELQTTCHRDTAACARRYLLARYALTRRGHAV